MYKIVTGIVCVMMVVILGTTLTVSGQEAEDVMMVPMGVITIDAPEGVEAKKRLKIMSESNDGFIIAEEDLKMRGPGQFMGFQQSGMMDPRVVSLMGDYKLLSKVQQAIAELNDAKYMDEAEVVKKEAIKRYEAKLRDIILN